jgi:hypothetical protein
MNAMPSKCPICSHELAVTRLYCANCNTQMEGQFFPGNNAFAPLTPEQLNFVLTFVRCEGRFNRMEEELSLSYPTLRSRLYDIIRALGYEPGKEEPVIKLGAEERRLILDELDQGKITWDEAQRRLTGKPEEQASA